MLRRVTLVLAVTLTFAASLDAQSIFTLAGGGTDDGRPATVAGLFQPEGVALGASGDVYIADSGNNRIRRVDSATGIISTVAGTGSSGVSGDGGPATAAGLAFPRALVLDSSGNLYIADSGNGRIRKVDAVSGIISTVAGGGSGSADGVPATATALQSPSGVALDASGNLYFAETGAHRVRRVDAVSGIISNVAGNGSREFSGDGGPAPAAGLYWPRSVALDASENVYITDSGNNRVRRIEAGSGIITTVAGNGSQEFSGDDGPATAAGLYSPNGLVLDESGNLYVADTYHSRIRRVDAVNGVISTVAGGRSDFSGDGGPATAAGLQAPADVAIDSSGDLYIADANRIRKVTAGSGIISTIAGNGLRGVQGDGSPATAAGLLDVRGVGVDAIGNVYVADRLDQRIRRVASGSGTISTVAGDGTMGGYSGDGGPATAAGIWLPEGVVVDGSGNLYISFETRIRKVDAGNGIISTVAGNGSSGFSGDGGPATAAELACASGAALDTSGNLYIADRCNNRVRRVAAVSGILSTVAGSGTTEEGAFSGDGGPATAAELWQPSSVVVDHLGDLYIADTNNRRIRKVAAGSGTISTMAGNGSAGSSGDGGPATAASIGFPRGIAMDALGNLYIADGGGPSIRRVDSATGIISTVAGGGTSSGTGDGGAATAAVLSYAHGVVVDASGNLYIADGDRVHVVFACVEIATPLLTSPSNGSSGVSTAPPLAWEAVRGALRYDIYLGIDPSRQTLAAIDVETTSFSPSNLEPGRIYYWKVVAKGDPFCVPFSAAPSEVWSFTTTSSCEIPEILGEGD